MPLIKRSLSLGVLRLLSTTEVKEDEASALVIGFWGFFSIMAGYFLLLPFRDEAGVSLGTHNLPKLFAASLLLTLLATPLASFFLNRHPVKELGLQQLYRFLSLTVLVFCGLYMLTGAPGLGQQQQRRQQEQLGGGLGSVAGGALADSLLEEAGLHEAAHGSRQQRQQLPVAQPGRRLQLVASSAEQRELGPQWVGRQLGAGLALGSQHEEQGREAAQWQQQQEEVGAAAGGASQVERRQRRRLAVVSQQQAEHHASSAAAGPAAAPLSAAQRGVRIAFFLSASLLNLVAVSSWWARAADVFSAEAAARLFGIMGAGATLGQLVGSLVAATLARAPFLRPSPASPSLLPLLLSAALLAIAGQCAVSFHVCGAAPAPPAPSLLLSAPGSGAARLTTSESWSALEEGAGLGTPSKASLPRGPLGSRGRTAGGRLWRRTLGSSAEGFDLIMCSGYLRHLCLFLVLNYIVSSFFFFEKSLVVAAAVTDAASRTAWFATVNSASAFCILALQLLATGPVLRYLGVPKALAVTPAAAGLLLAAVALNPTPTSVGLAEVLRKVLTYSLARPAREVLFTVVTREEKYKAKIFVDTVVQRCGDALAAGAFQALDGVLGLGPAGVAVAAVPVCCAWVGVAHALGRRQEQLAAGMRRRRLEASAML